jgi:hypothetical protein
MNPKPFASLNHFTIPVAIVLSKKNELNASVCPRPANESKEVVEN